MAALHDAMATFDLRNGTLRPRLLTLTLSLSLVLALPLPVILALSLSLSIPLTRQPAPLLR